MGIEIFNGSTWVSNNDPEIFNGSSFVNIKKGEVYNGSGWNTFYQRFSGTVNTPTITLQSRTLNSITVKVELQNGSPHKTQVLVYRDTNPFGLAYVPATAAVGAISGTKTETGLSVNTSYTFSAYAIYYDASTNEQVASSTTVSETFSTLNYSITVPTTPVNKSREKHALKFESTSNAKYSINASTAYIEFELQALDPLSGWFYVADKDSSNLSSNDLDESKEVTFNNLNSGTTYRCRARTKYSTISQNSNYSEYSSNITTLQTVVKNTGYISSNNTTYLSNGFAIAGSQLSSNPANNGSNNNFSDNWISNPVSGTETLSESRSVTNLSRGLGVLKASVGTVFSGASANKAKLSGVTGLRYNSPKVYTFNLNNTRFTWLYFLSNIPYTTSNQVTLGNFSSSLAINGVRTITGVATQGQSHVRKFQITGAALTGSASNPTITSGYLQGASLSSNKSEQTPHSVETDPISGNIIAILFNDTGTTFPTAESVGGTLTRYYTTTTYKGSGNEALTVYFQAKSGTYSTPRMISGSNHLRVKNGSGARYIAASINGTSLGSLYFESDQIRDFTIPSQINPKDEGLLGANYFTVSLTVPRVDSGFGWYASIYETQISYSYNQLE